MKPEELAELPDWVLALLYTTWSEEWYAAGWMLDHETDTRFLQWMQEHTARTLDNYERDGAVKMRAALLRETGR